MPGRASDVLIGGAQGIDVQHLLPAQRSPRRRVVLQGLPLDALDEAGVIRHILDALDAGLGGWLVNPNVDVLRQITLSSELQKLVSGASLVVCDGAPLEWATRLAGDPIPSRVPGATLIWSLARAAAKVDRSIFLLGGAPGVAVRAGEALRAQSPGLRVAGTHCPPLGFEKKRLEHGKILETLGAAGPDIVFCGLGFPKQERLMSELAGQFSRTWFIGSGASLTFAAGDVRRAPVALQTAGMEWLFRLACEPRRLARRYLVHGIPFASKLLLEAALSRGKVVDLREEHGNPMPVPVPRPRSSTYPQGSQESDR